jgi:hypothetical protein
MFGFLKSTAGGYEVWERHKASASSYALVPNHQYAVVLKYSGQGAGGPLSSSQIQGYLASSQSGGAAPGTVMSTTTDPTSKTITYLLSTLAELQPQSVPAAGLVGATFPAAFGTVTVQSVTDVGSSLVAAS